MNKLALEFRQALDIWPINLAVRENKLSASKLSQIPPLWKRILLEKSCCVDQYIDHIIFYRPGLVDFNLPLSQLIIPNSFLNPRVELDIPAQIPLLRCPLDVLINLGTGSIKLRPVGIGLEKKSVRIWPNVR